MIEIKKCGSFSVLMDTPLLHVYYEHYSGLISKKASLKTSIFFKGILMKGLDISTIEF